MKLKMAGQFSNIYLCYFFDEMLIQEFIDEQTELFSSTHFIDHRLLVFIFKPNAKIFAFRTKRIDNPKGNDKKGQDKIINFTADSL